ncbi:hypothetical protein EJ08DRAFT_319688 [Tothia fuscella]|uniref:Uncharacterized protein n=1 Tax=Tothia fuscella TaxID=1048955 RepID=A0A9P4NP73_9PEZI|nr:hypothetical protein EJ08DRAFT_319688 [Tothia fuscella]
MPSLCALNSCTPCVMSASVSFYGLSGYWCSWRRSNLNLDGKIYPHILRGAFIYQSTRCFHHLLPSSYLSSHCLFSYQRSSANFLTRPVVQISSTIRMNRKPVIQPHTSNKMILRCAYMSDLYLFLIECPKNKLRLVGLMFWALGMNLRVTT